MLTKAKNKSMLAIVFMTLIVFLPVFASRLKRADKMIMSYDDNKKVEKEILKRVPIGSSVQLMKQVMNQNKFASVKQTSSSLDFEREESYWPTYEGTIWYVEMFVKDGTVAGTKVWIQPAD